MKLLNKYIKKLAIVDNHIVDQKTLPYSYDCIFYEC